MKASPLCTCNVVGMRVYMSFVNFSAWTTFYVRSSSKRWGPYKKNKLYWMQYNMQ